MKKGPAKGRYSSDKFEGRLRAIGRSSTKVNASRSESIGAVRVANQSILDQVDPTVIREEITPEQSIRLDAPALKRLKKGKDDAATNEILVQGFAILSSEDTPLKHPLITGRRGRVCTFQGTQSEVESLQSEPAILSIRLGETLRRPTPQRGNIATKGPTPRKIKFTANEPAFGENILIGIVDVGGFDFAHQDFTEAGKTRFVRIWDQGGSFRDPPRSRSADSVFPATFDYGSEILAEHMNHAMLRAGQLGVPATELEAQSQMEPASHATHVASIAAGNHSPARRAKIAGVLLSLPVEDYQRRLSFYDTTRVAHAIEYLLALGEEIGAAAVSINISLGTNGGPHDDSAPMSRWIDYALTRPGRAVCVAAGNAGQEAPQHAQDIGFVMGRIHTSGQVNSAELEQRLDWIVVGNGVEDVSENELEVWYPPQDRIAVQLRPPGGDWLPPVEPGEFTGNYMLPNERTFVSIYNELYDAGNGHNRIFIYLSPFLSPDQIAGIKPGVWSVRLIGRQIRDGRYHGWIERDDPGEIGRIGERAIWRFPSFFAEASNVDNTSISTLACGPRVISVANLDAGREMVNPTSSQGPTRDGREKPDVAAPGTHILAANGFDPEVPWIEKTGTSMATPFVTAVAGLMLSLRPQLTASQISGILRRTAAPLPGHSFDWRNDAGFGEIDLDACLVEARQVGQMREVLP